MSDTPRTDAETWRDEMDHVDTDYTFAQSATVSADFARQIERELAEAKFDLQFRRDLYTLQSKELAEAMEQRDTLAEALDSSLGILIALIDDNEGVYDLVVTTTNKNTGEENKMSVRKVLENSIAVLAAVKGGKA